MKDLKQEYNTDDEFLNKFGYRVYSGKSNSRFHRVWSSIVFELKSTWHRSTFGKVLLVISMTFNVIFVIIAANVPAGFSDAGDGRTEQQRNQDTLNSFVGSYLRTFGQAITASSDQDLADLGPPMGFFLLIVFSIAGSGMFADDKNGKVVKSKAKKNEKVLKEMIKQKNADKVGEFSLTDARFSRITEFMATTLYDENVGGKYGNTHIALGASFHDCYKGDPSKVTKKQWEKMGF
ncbi:MAG: aminopeptidase, partial [Candidatus Heimdallarchaeota archaeon]|nr:aminopeptidase [Candidatus Heimdallarchaeota archaeon]